MVVAHSRADPGVVPILSGVETCPRCEGATVLDAERLVPDAEIGTDVVEMSPQPCPECDGTGRADGDPAERAARGAWLAKHDLVGRITFDEYGEECGAAALARWSTRRTPVAGISDDSNLPANHAPEVDA